MKSLVFLPYTTGFVKFGSSGTLISNLTKSPPVFHARGSLPELGQGSAYICGGISVPHSYLRGELFSFSKA